MSNWSFLGKVRHLDHKSLLSKHRTGALRKCEEKLVSNFGGEYPTIPTDRLGTVLSDATTTRTALGPIGSEVQIPVLNHLFGNQNLPTLAENVRPGN